MQINDWLLIASLGVSGFVVLSQIGLVRQLNELREVAEVLLIDALLRAEIEKREDEENNGH